MTAKDYLSAVQEMDKDINTQKEYIEALKGVLESTGVNISDERVQSSSDPDKFGKIFAQIDEEERKLEKMKFDLLMYRIDVCRAIHNVETAKYCDLLYKRYILYHSFGVVARQMGYSYDYILELHGKALVEFEQMNPWLFC